MSNQVLPNTDKHSIAVLAIAWEIVKLTTGAIPYDSPEQKRVDLTNQFIEVHKAITNETPIA